MTRDPRNTDRRPSSVLWIICSEPVGLYALWVGEVDLVIGFRVFWHEVDRERVALFDKPVIDLFEVYIGEPFEVVASKEVVFDFFGSVLIELIDVVGRFERE